MALPVFPLRCSALPVPTICLPTILQEPVRIARWCSGQRVSLYVAGKCRHCRCAGGAVFRDSRCIRSRGYGIGGSAIVATSGFVDIVADPSVVRVLHGSVLVLRDAMSVTAVALTSPLLVESAGSSTLLPRGYQMRMEGGKMEYYQRRFTGCGENASHTCRDAGLSQSATEAIQLLGISRCTSLPAPLLHRCLCRHGGISDDSRRNCRLLMPQLRLMPSDPVPYPALFALLSQRRNAANLLGADVP